MSDPGRLATAAGAELLISCFVSSRTEPAAFLHSAQRTGEAAPGHQLGQRQLTGPERFTSLYWIAQVLTDTPARGPVIVALGDSITRGDGTTADRDQRYPDHLQHRLIAAGAGDAAVLNAGLGVNRLLQPRLGPSMLGRLDRDLFSMAEATHVIIMGGLNDLAMPSILGGQRPPAGDIIEGLFTLAGRAQEHGVQPVLGTITPLLTSSYESFRAEGNEEIRRAVNQAIAAQKDWAVADFAARLGAPDDPARLAPPFDSGDGVHPGDAGARALADAIDLTLFG